MDIANSTEILGSQLDFQILPNDDDNVLFTMLFIPTLCSVGDVQEINEVSIGVIQYKDVIETSWGWCNCDCLQNLGSFSFHG